MTKRSLTPVIDCKAVDEITICLFNEVGDLIEEFTAIDSDYGIFIPEWDEDYGISIPLWEEWGGDQLELMKAILSVAEDHFQQTRTDRMPFFG